MHVILVNLGYPEDCVTPEALLERFANLGGWAEALMRLPTGGDVTVVQRFRQAASLERNGVEYRFVGDRLGPVVRAWQVSANVNKVIVDLCGRHAGRDQATIVHLNGMMYGLQARLLRRSLPQAVPIVIQHHAEGAQTGMRGGFQRWALRDVDGFLFAARALADPWIHSGMIQSQRDVFEVMEGSTTFRPQDRAVACQVTGMAGSPIFLSVGRLIDIKDPLTVLDGFERIVGELPQARLYLVHFRRSDLLSQVQQRIADRPALSNAVRLLQDIPHPEMEWIYNSADYILLGSHREGSGFALLEALACGVVPIVTDIPSFRLMTDGGRIGALWPPGNSDALAASALSVTRRSWDAESTAARRQFEECCSFDAIGREASAAYRTLLERRYQAR